MKTAPLFLLSFLIVSSSFPAQAEPTKAGIDTFANEQVFAVQGEKVGAWSTEELAVLGNVSATGDVKLGNSGQDCGVANRGALRFDTTKGSVMYCDGTWKPVSSFKSCPDGATLYALNGDWKCQYTLVSGGVAYCRTGDVRVSCTDTGYGQNHGITLMAPNGCYAWEGTNNKGGQQLTMVCREQ